MNSSPIPLHNSGIPLAISYKTLSTGCVVKWLIILSTLLSSPLAEEQWPVGDIQFIGNYSIRENKLLDQMILKPKGIFQKIEFSFSQLVEDIAALQEFYRRQGFFNANVNLAKLDRDSSARTVDIVLIIDEGHQTKIDTVTFSGDAVIETLKLLGSTGMEPGEPLLLEGIDSLQGKIYGELHEKGYMFAQVECCYELDSSRTSASVDCDIETGPFVRAGVLNILGLDKVKEIVVERELQFSGGNLLTSDSIERSINRIYTTGLFEFAGIEPVDTFSQLPDSDSVTVPVLIQVRELERMFQVQIGGGYQSARGFYLDGEASYRNFFGLGHRLTGSGDISSSLQGTRLKYSYPWIFSLPLDADFTSFLERRDEDLFTGLFYGGEAALGGELGMYNSFRAWSRLERVNWIDDPSGAGQDLRLNTLILGLAVRRDTRLSPLLPGSAVYMHLEGQIAGPGLSWSNQFYKSVLDFRAYFGFFDRRWGISSAILAGYVDGYGESGDLVPPQELFFPGVSGGRSVRGYDEETIMPVNDQGDAVGGKLQLIINAFELRFPVYKWFSGAVFVDAGNIWASAENSAFSDLHWSVGAGVRIMWPFFLARFDYGIRLDSDADLDGRLEFAAGLPF